MFKRFNSKDISPGRSGGAGRRRLGGIVGLILQILWECGSGREKRGHAPRMLWLLLLLLLLLAHGRTTYDRMNGCGIMQVMVSSAAGVLDSKQDRRGRHAVVVGRRADGRTHSDIGRRMMQHGAVRRRRRTERRTTCKKGPRVSARTTSTLEKLI